MTRPLRDLIPNFIRELDPYVAGRPIEEVEREMGVHAIKLASNENPLGPSPKAVAAAQRVLGSSNRYPDAAGTYLREALAERLGVPEEMIALGAGSTELIDLAARALLHAGDSGLTGEGSFPMYSISIRAAAAKLVKVPLRNYGFDLDEMAKAVTPETKIIYFANPNNPTGTLFTASEFDRFLSRIPEHPVVVLDEAYFDYVAHPDYSRSIELVRGGRHLLVLRTFSKVHGLAGLRIGYGIGPAELVEAMNRVRSPFNTSAVAQAAALAALDDAEHVRRSLESNRAGISQLGRGLDELGVRFVPSFGNFVLVELGRDADPVSTALLSRGVIVRPMRWMGFPQAIRVTIGTAEEIDKFLAALADVMALPARAELRK